MCAQFWTHPRYPVAGMRHDGNRWYQTAKDCHKDAHRRTENDQLGKRRGGRQCQRQPERLAALLRQSWQAPPGDLDRTPQGPGGTGWARTSDIAVMGAVAAWKLQRTSGHPDMSAQRRLLLHQFLRKSQCRRCRTECSVAFCCEALSFVTRAALRAAAIAMAAASPSWTLGVRCCISRTYSDSSAGFWNRVTTPGFLVTQSRSRDPGTLISRTTRSGTQIDSPGSLSCLRSPERSRAISADESKTYRSNGRSG